MKSLSAKQYIRNPEGLEEYQCGVCYELPEEVYQCQGPCRTKFCLTCFSKIKASGDQCPMRCSKPFEISPCKTALISFACPFDPAHCPAELTTVHEFNHHYTWCKHISSEWGEWLKCRNNYLCDAGHQLLFLQEDTLTKMYGYGQAYTAANNHVCVACGEQGLSRSICPECSTMEKKVIYCGKCRRIPCTQTKCTYEHPITEREAYHHAMICDFCGVSCKIRGASAFSDTKCNFDVCEICYKGMPESHPQVPSLREEKAVEHLFKKQNVFGGNPFAYHAPHVLAHPMWYADSSDEEIDMVLGGAPNFGFHPNDDDEGEEEEPEEEPEAEVSVGHASEDEDPGFDIDEV